MLVAYRQAPRNFGARRCRAEVLGGPFESARAASLVVSVLRRRAAGALIVVALGAIGCGGHGVPEGYQGLIEFDEQLVASEVGGRVSDVLVRRGAMVSDQQELIRLDPTFAELAYEARNQLEASSRAELALLQAGASSEDVEATAAAVRGMRARMDYARRSAARARSLGESGSIARNAVDRATTELEAAAAEHRSLERQLASLRRGSRPEQVAALTARVAALSAETALEQEKLARHTLRSKGEGMVVDVSVQRGELVAVGTPCVTVADVTHPYADVFVPEAELDGIRLGSRATLRIDGTEDSFAGVVEYIAPRPEFTPRFLFSEAERTQLVFRVRVRVDDATARLHAGVPAFVQIDP